MDKVTIENIPWQKQLEEFQDKFERMKSLDYFKIQEELKRYIVTLDSDPTSVGVGNLNEKIAKVDSYIGRVVTILMNSIANENKFNLFFNDIQAFYNKYLRIQLRQKELQEYSNQTIRQAVAEEKIEDIGNLKHIVEQTLENAKTHTKICREKLNNLSDTQKNISRQITVIQTQLEIGEIQRKINNRDNNF